MNVIQAEMERLGITEFDELILIAAVMTSFGGKIHLNDFRTTEAWELYTEDLVSRRRLSLTELIEFLEGCGSLYGLQAYEVRRANRIDVAFSRCPSRSAWNWEWFFSILCRRLRTRDINQVQPWFRIAHKNGAFQLILGCPYAN